MRSNLPVCVPLFLLAAASPARAIQPISDGDQVRVSLPSGTTPQPVLGATAVGEFTGDLRRDVCLLAGGTPWIVAAPESLQAIVPLTTPGTISATDVAVLPGATLYGLDLLLVTSDRGLESYEIDAATNTFVASLLAQGPWVSARSLSTVDLDGDGDLDVLGLSADGQTVLRVSCCGPGCYVELESIDLAGAATAAIGVPWDDTLDELEIDWTEIALMRDHGVEILDSVGTQLDDFTSSSTSIALHPLEVASAGEHQLLWITQAPNGTDHWLQVLHPDGTCEPGFGIGVFRPTGIASADFGFDGDDDVVLLGTLSPDYVLLGSLASQGGTPAGNSFDPAPTSAWVIPVAPLGTTMTGQASRPVMADLDNDGDTDLCVTIQGSNEVVVQRNFETSETDQRVAPNGATVWMNGNLDLHSIAAPAVQTFTATHIEGSIFAVDSSQNAIGDPWCSFDAPLVGGVVPSFASFECPPPPSCGFVVHPEYGGVSACDHRVVVRLVERVGGINVHAGPDSSFLYQGVALRLRDGVVGGTTPIPNIGPTPPGMLPPRPPGSQPPPP